MQVESFLEQSALRFPDKTALICATRRLTYGEIEAQSNRLAHALLAQGMERGDRVAIYLDNSAETVAAIFAVLKAGGVFLVVNPTTKINKLSYILNNCAARVLVTDSGKVRTLESERPEIPSLRTIWLTGPAGDLPASSYGTVRSLEDMLNDAGLSDRAPAKRCIDIDLAALIYTSGSTGQPKGVTVTHLNIVSAATSITTYLENTSGDIIINLLPLAFDYGLYQLLMAFKSGATLVLERSFTYPHAVLQTIIREKVTGFPIVPTISAILLEMDLSQYDLSCIRYISNTAAALPTEHIRKLRRLFPNVQLYSMYGLTECKRVSYLPPSQIDIRPNSVGKGMPNEEVYVVDDQGRRVPPGTIGELVVRGSNVMKCYWGDPVETAKKLKPGPYPWEMALYTGDLFKMDEEGYLYFVGRKDDIIKTRGEKVSPKEVEDVLYSLDGILEAAVIGVDDPVLGQSIKAVVTVREGMNLTEQLVLRHCARHLEDFMVPKAVEFRDSLPKTSSGKISKKEMAYS